MYPAEPQAWHKYSAGGCFRQGTLRTHPARTGMDALPTFPTDGPSERYKQRMPADKRMRTQTDP